MMDAESLMYKALLQIKLLTFWKILCTIIFVEF